MDVGHPTDSTPIDLSATLNDDARQDSHHSFVEGADEHQYTIEWKKPANKHDAPYVYVSPSSNVDKIRDDLKAMGFSSKEIKELMRRKEVPVDSTTQRPPVSTPFKMTTAQVEDHAMTGSFRKSRRADKKDLVLGQDEKWVLFDCADGFPSFGQGHETPAIFERYSRFEPGNARIVEVNIETGSMRLKATPDVLRGRSVEYTRNGPKLVDLIELKPAGRAGHAHRHGPQPERTSGIQAMDRFDSEQEDGRQRVGRHGSGSRVEGLAESEVGADIKIEECDD